MSEADRLRWNQRWAAAGPPPITSPADAPPHLGESVTEFPRAGSALDLACGRGRSSVWLARRGLRVLGIDVSNVAIDLAARHAEACRVQDRTKFAVFDLERGLPPGPPVGLVLSHLYWTPLLTAPMVERLAPGGLLAVCHVSEVGVGRGAERIAEGALRHAFADFDELEVLDDHEADGIARFVARRRP